ncbi:ABC transporter permease [Pseudomonas sp. JUb96]|uniref:ABC transporter permease n=1 Tax=Pseudomonas sp. JUb96 TaxID=2940539 RepID=UPI002227C887|nr:ABC transporter permease [Pseudomonas sp. JUb96]MCW2271846.1 peptide/nickel transport system permease protein [Pseudomonas sp. JUb96]
MQLFWKSAPYLLRQFCSIAAISFIIFMLVRAVPGDVTDYYSARGDYDANALQAMRQQLGLDDSLAVQFVSWLKAALQGDLGQSMRFGTAVSGMLGDALPNSLLLSAAALSFGLLTGMAIAVLALAFPAWRLGKLLEGLNVWSIAVPTFCTGVIVILVFSVWLRWLPIRGQLLMPVIILGLDIAGQVVKPLYEELRTTMQAPFVRTARAKGLSNWRIAWRHVLPNSLSVLVAMSGVILGGLIGGTLTMEALFSLPGLGSLTLEAIHGRDYTVIQAAVMLLATFVVLVNIATAALQVWIDPRLTRNH